MKPNDEWETLVKDMDLSTTAKVGTVENIRWFVDNGALANKNHSNFNDALLLAKKITRYGSFDDGENYR